jgi:hypothetical protein
MCLAHKPLIEHHAAPAQKPNFTAILSPAENSLKRLNKTKPPAGGNLRAVF